eukprot:Nitzschia sp. Nitz4//scaffold260_size33533//25408//26125//NITZ4_007881-RA/size33533-augustus-gene-0.13-mRNA-1//1//CDS//3329544689//46//frame0
MKSIFSTGLRRSLVSPLVGEKMWLRMCPHVSARFLSAATDGGTRSKSGKPRPDPFARRPNKKCDPYGQGGKPLSSDDAHRLMGTVGSGWELKHNKGEIESDMPQILERSFEHPDFMSASSFLTHIAAVAQMNDHFPSMKVERKLDSRLKVWRNVSTISCRTFVLEGLSHHDFFLATLIDVEVERPEIRSLLIETPSKL